MNKKHSRAQKKLAILPILLVGMLVSTGAAYAYWYDTLTVDGTVTTAYFNVELSLPTTWYYDCEWKDVVTENDISFLWDKIDPDPDAYDKITITVNNAYPGYHGAIRIGIVSTGNIPAHMKGDPVITTVDEIDVWFAKEGQVCDPPYDDPFPYCWQLHQQEYFFMIHFEVIEDDYAGILPQQGATYTFTITFPLIQYNYDADCDYSAWQ